ncbi:hypothetical protein PMAC_001288 [Pneumocystis sp. 'macacae']|nr:hypothetical protein PMAC_001288 [Pneumocystis sp. 'macacae']
MPVHMAQKCVVDTVNICPGNASNNVCRDLMYFDIRKDINCIKCCNKRYSYIRNTDVHYVLMHKRVSTLFQQLRTHNYGNTSVAIVILGNIVASMVVFCHGNTHDWKS